MLVERGVLLGDGGYTCSGLTNLSRVHVLLVVMQKEAPLVQLAEACLQRREGGAHAGAVRQVENRVRAP